MIRDVAQQQNTCFAYVRPVFDSPIPQRIEGKGRTRKGKEGEGGGKVKGEKGTGNEERTGEEERKVK